MLELAVNRAGYLISDEQVKRNGNFDVLRRSTCYAHRLSGVKKDAADIGKCGFFLIRKKAQTVKIATDNKALWGLHIIKLGSRRYAVGMNAID